MNSKKKGGSFERKICVALSLLLSGGKRKDLFWRSAMSGGRATVHARKGTDIRQAGDITAVAPEGHEFTDYWFVEAKNVRDAGLASFLVSNEGPLAKFWRVAQEQAKRHEREPMIIIRARGPTLIVTRQLHHIPTNAQVHLNLAEPILSSDLRWCDVHLLATAFSACPEAVASLRRSKKQVMP